MEDNNKQEDDILEEGEAKDGVRSRPHMVYSAGMVQEWTVVYSNSSSSVFDDEEADRTGADDSGPEVIALEQVVPEAENVDSVLPLPATRRYSVSTSSSSIIVLNDEGSESSNSDNVVELKISSSSETHADTDEEDESGFIREDIPAPTAEKTSVKRNGRRARPRRSTGPLRHHQRCGRASSLKAAVSDICDSQDHEYLTDAFSESETVPVPPAQQPPLIFEKGNIHDGSLVSLSLSSLMLSGLYPLQQIRDQYLIPTDGLRHRTQVHRCSDGEKDGDQTTSTSSDRYNFAAAKTQPIRAYFHRPNPVLNGKLNLILVLSLTAVMSLGIGHFLGWSSKTQQPPLSLAQVFKLKQIQEDLLVCLDAQRQPSDEPDQKVCVNDRDYWTERFRSLFDENQGLKAVFEKTQKHFAENRPGAILGDEECANQSTNDEFHNLDLDLLVGQMEHLKLLERSESRVRKLEEENQDLKKKLEEEEDDDIEMARNYNRRVARLEEENQELRAAMQVDDVEDERVVDELQSKIRELTGENRELCTILDHLEGQLFPEPNRQSSIDDGDDDRTVTGGASWNRYSSVRQRVNQLLHENEELKSKVARYRWTKATATTVENNKNRNKAADNRDKLQQQLKIRLELMNRQLKAAKEENRILGQRNRFLEEKNKRMAWKLRQNQNRAQVDGDGQHNYSDNHYQENGRERTSEQQQQERNQFWSTWMDQMVNRWTDRIKDMATSAGQNANIDPEKLLGYGQKWMRSTMDQMSKLAKNLDSDQKNLVGYLSDRLNRFSSAMEKSFQSTFEELKSVVSPHATHDRDEWSADRPSTKKLRSKKIPLTDGDEDQEADKKQSRERKRKLKKLRKKLLREIDESDLKRLEELLLEEKLQKDFDSSWVMGRAQARQQAREHHQFETDVEEESDEDQWFLQRGRARQKSRIGQEL